MTQEQLNILRFQLPPFGEGAKPSAELRAFCRAYGLDFDERYERLQHLAGYVASGDYQLAVHQWRQPGAVANLFIVHGYYDHVGLFGKLVEWGLARGCNVVAFDLPGHGLSTGESAEITDFAHYGQAIAAVLERLRLPDLPLWTMAQSTGCAALVEFARAYDYPFAATVMLAPLVRPARWRGIRLAHSVLGRFVSSVPRSFARNSSDEEFLAFVHNDPLQCQRVPLVWVGALRRWLATLPRVALGAGPALIVQGDNDHTVDWQYNVAFMQDLFPGSEVEYVSGAGHQLANESAGLRERYLLEVADYLARCNLPLAH